MDDKSIHEKYSCNISTSETQIKINTEVIDSKDSKAVRKRLKIELGNFGSRILSKDKKLFDEFVILYRELLKNTQE